MKKSRFNVIDFFIIIAAVVVIVGILSRIYIDQTTGIAYNETADICFVIKSTTNSCENGLNKGDKFTWNGSELGSLKTFSITEAKTVMLDNDKKAYVTVTDKERKDVKGIISSQGAFTDDGFMLEGSKYIGAGMHMLIQSGVYKVDVLVLSVDKAS